jgi:hypothetical protein
MAEYKLTTTDRTEYIEQNPPFEKEDPLRFPLFEHKYDDDYRNPCKNCPNFKEGQINICHCVLPYIGRTI